MPAASAGASIRAGIAAVLCLAAASSPASPNETASFPIVPPAAPLVLELSSAPIPEWGRTPRLRAIYYVTKDQTPNDLDRATIMRELKLIRDFYAHYGLAVEYEDRVYEVRGEAAADLPAEQYDYSFIKKALERRGLLLNRRTIVFTTFDVGLGAHMALTGLNNANTARVECPRAGKGSAWWCGRPESAHWGGSVHEVGHMFGLVHPSDFTREAPYRFADGRAYVYSDGDAVKTVMKRHDRFFRHPDNGLLPHEIDALSARYGAGAPAR